MKETPTIAELPQFDLFINGQTVPAESKGCFDSLNPSTGEILAKLAEATENDIRKAITAAEQFFS